MPALSRYQDIHISDWQLRCCGGDAAQAYAACHSGNSQLQAGEHGWIGQIDTSPQDLFALAEEVAGTLWLRNEQRSAGQPPICCISSSKGAIHQHLSGELPFQLAWPGSLSGELCRRLGIATWIGRSCAAACSTGLYSLLDAADLLSNRLGKQALCGAADTSLDPMLLAGYRNLGVMAQSQPTAFDGSGSGFAPAEGAAFFHLAASGPWRLVAGVRAGDASHITRCDDAELLRDCLEDLWQALPEPELIVTHATGTAHGDAFEAAALEAGPWRSAELLHCKPAIGHCLGASGSVELAIGLESPARRLWKLSLGFGGHIAAVALERNH